MKRLLFVLFLLIPSFIDGQIITTVAGGGTGGLGDNGPATSATLGLPGGEAFDAAGNMYIVDAGGKRIRKVSTDGIITTIAGTGATGSTGDGGPATNATFNNPSYIAVDTMNNIYVSDPFVNKVRIISSSGMINTFAGTGVAGYNGDGIAATAADVNDPTTILPDNLGNVYIGEGIRVRKVSAAGIISTVAGGSTAGYSGDGGPATAALLRGVSGIVMDKSGNIYFGDNDNYRIRKIATSGIITTIAGNGTAPPPGLPPDGVQATNTEFIPWDIKMDKFGNIFISDYERNIIQMITSSGYTSTIAGNGVQGYYGDNGPATAAELFFTYGLALDECSNLYIADGQNYRIRKVTYPKCNYLGVTEAYLQNINVSIYPNPVADVLHIDNVQGAATYRLLSIIGAVIQHGMLKAGSNSIAMGAFPGGMYLLEMSGEEAITAKKVVKIVKE